MIKAFEIGDVVFMSDYGKHETFVTCPDCQGSKHVRVILGDNTEIIIECGGCDPGGFQPSTGMIRQYKYKTCIRKHKVTAVKIMADRVEYDLDNFGNGSYYTGNNDNVFATEDKAIVYGELQKAKLETNENKRLMGKTKDTKSWAWNATYHRNYIKKLESELEYHRSKVEICTARIK